MPDGTSTTVNTYTAGYQAGERILILSNGQILVAWQSDSAPSGDTDRTSIWARLFSATGIPIGPEFQMNTSTAGFQNTPALADLENNKFVGVWYNNGSYVGQLFDYTGNKLGDEFSVDTLSPAPFGRGISVTALKNGGFVATWVDSVGDLIGSPIAIKLQIFNSDGEKAGQSILLTDHGSKPTICSLSNGNVLIAWQGDESFFGQIVDPNGNYLGSRLSFGEGNLGDISAISMGGFVIHWQNNQTSTDRHAEVLAARFDNSGTPVGEPITLEFASTGNFDINLTAVSSGGYAAAVRFGGSPGEPFTLSLVRYNTNFVETDREFISSGFQQTGGRVAMLQSGQLVSTWSNGDILMQTALLQDNPTAALAGMDFATLSDLAELSAAAYGGSSLSLPEGWHILSHDDLGGFAIPASSVNEESFFDSEGFFNFRSGTPAIDLQVFAVASVDNKIAIVFRGTQGAIDLATDLLIPSGILYVALDKIVSFTNAVKQYASLHGSSLYAAGHSLGGALAELMVAQHPSIFAGGLGLGSPGYGFTVNDFASDSSFIHVAHNTDGIGHSTLSDSHVGAKLLIVDDTFILPSYGWAAHSSAHYVRNIFLIASSDAFSNMSPELLNRVYVADQNEVFDDVVPIEEYAFLGTHYNDVINGSNHLSSMRIDSGDGNDSITGGAAGDVLVGGTGSDTIDGGQGNDALFGGAGNDRLIVAPPGSGSHVDGGANIDTLAISGVVSLGTVTSLEVIELAGGSALTLTGAQVASGFALYTAVTGSGSLIVNMTAGQLLGTKFWTIAPGIAVTVNGTSGTDIMKLGNNAQTVSGGDGTDQIKGGSAVDTIDGGAGIDKIMGLGGADILTGGAGNDVFRYLAQNDSGLGAAADRITDFAIGQDRLNFVQIDADAALAGDQAFTFIGNAVFGTPGTGQIRYEDSGADLQVLVDVNGDGAADMSVILQGLAGQVLGAGSFVL